MKNIIAVIASAAVLASAMSTTAMAAASANVTLSPNGGSYTTGSNFNVQIHENGDAVNVVTVKLAYDASKLTCNGVSNGSAFPGVISATCGGGSVTISNYATPGTTVSGDAVVGTVSFTAVAAGSAAVSVAAGTQVASNGNNTWNGAANTATFTVTTPVAPAPTPQPTTPPTGGTAKSTGSTPKTTAATNSATTTPQVAGAKDTKPADVATTSDTPAKDSSNKAATTVAADNSSNTATWVAGSVAVILVAATAAYFWLTRRHPEYLKYVSKKVNL